jgi:vitamin B12 transporter
MRVSILILFLFSSVAFADDAIIVTATRSESSSADLPYSTGSISGEDWQQRGGLPENALSGITGLSFTAPGGPGQTRTILIRGAKAEHTLVLIDGMVVNDPLSPSRTFDFSQIPVSEIERIEVIKGPQSVLYGSDAMGGVIQIFTKKGAQPAKARLEAGSYQSGKANFSYLGFHAGYETTKGFSAADEREGNSERDGHRAWRIGGNKEFSLSDNFFLRMQADYDDSVTDTDANGGRGSDTFGTYTTAQQLLFRTDGFWQVSEDLDWTNALSISTHDRDDNTTGPAFYKAYVWKAESVARKKFSRHQATIGLEGGQEAGRSSEIAQLRKFQTGAVYLQDQFGSRWHGTAGARIDARTSQKLAPTFRAGLGYWFLPEKLRIKSSAGPGFKAPTLYQVYSRYGTGNLTPERSFGADLGVELVTENWRSELTGYLNHFRNLIDFDPVRSHYFNLAAARTYGIEWSLSRTLGRVTLANSLTTLHSLDTATRLPLYRRPVISDTIEASYRERDKRGASARLRYVGKRDDIHPTLFTRQRMPPFATVEADFFQRLSREYKLVVRGENLANRHYQEVSGYGVPEISAYAGIEAEW